MRSPTPNEVAVAGLTEHLGRDPPGGDQLGPDLRRQLFGHGVAPHDQQRPVALQDVGQVPADRGRDHLLLGAAPDPPVRVVDRDDVRVAHAQPDRGGALPGVGEPVDLGQLDRAGVAHQQLEHAAGPDRGELLVVAGIEQLGAGGGDDRGDSIEVLGGAHAGLVDHDQVLRAQWVAHPALLVRAEPAQELPGVQRGEPVLDEHLRGHVRGRHTEDPAADLLLPHLGQRPDGAGLPGSRRSDQHVAAPPGRQDLQHRLLLIGPEPGCLQAPPWPAPTPVRTPRRRRWRGRARRWPLRSPAARWWRTPRRCASGSGSARRGGAAPPARSRRRGPTA